MRSLKKIFVVGVAGALTITVLTAATSIITDGSVESEGFLISGSGVITHGDISARGIVESGSGGFKFPDGTVQTTAATDLTTVANTGVGLQVFGCDLSNGDVLSDCAYGGVVPAGKIFVVEFVSVTVEVPPTQSPPMVDLQVLLSGGMGFYDLAWVPVRFSGTYSSSDRYRWASQVRAYLEEGENVGLRIYRSTTTGNASASAMVWGYYVGKL